jgi:hypothetical protein
VRLIPQARLQESRRFAPTACTSVVEQKILLTRDRAARLRTALGRLVRTIDRTRADGFGICNRCSVDE